MSLAKKIKAKKRWKDYQKKRDMIEQQIAEFKNGTRKGFSVFFPKSRKYPEEKLIRDIEPRQLERKHNIWKRILKFIINLFKRNVERK